MPKGAQSWENETQTKVPAGELTAPGSPQIWIHTCLFPGQGQGGREKKKRVMERAMVLSAEKATRREGWQGGVWKEKGGD